MLFSNTCILPHQSRAVDSADAAKQPGQSVGRRVVASTGGENTQHLILCKGFEDGISDSEVENG